MHILYLNKNSFYINKNSSRLKYFALKNKIITKNKNKYKIYKEKELLKNNI